MLRPTVSGGDRRAVRAGEEVRRATCRDYKRSCPLIRVLLLRRDGRRDGGSDRNSPGSFALVLRWLNPSGVFSAHLG